jgi:hypothetical protein
METERIPAARAAEELKTTLVKVLMLLRKKSLDGELIDGEWHVTRASLECLKLHGFDATVPSSCRTSCNGTSCGAH